MRAARMFVDELHRGHDDSRSRRLLIRLLGSLGATGAGHGTPDAVVAGLRGWLPEDCDPESVRGQWDRLTECPLVETPLGALLVRHDDIRFDPSDRSASHPNAIEFTAYDEHGGVLAQSRYLSIGGGTVVAEGASVADGPTDVRWQFAGFAELAEICRRYAIPIAEVVRQNEQQRGNDPDRHLSRVWSVMSAAIDRGAEGSSAALPGGLGLHRRAPQLRRVHAAVRSGGVGESDLTRLHASAMAVSEENAAGHRVVTAPTNGAAGIIPAVIDYYLHTDGAERSGVATILLTAGAIGAIIKAGASISGAEVGCQGEVGTACAMAAGALCAVLGGSPDQVGKAAEIGLEHHLGLTCDPIAGLVQIPCIERNAVAAVTAVQAAVLTLAEGEPRNRVTLDAAVKTMAQVGADMHAKYKETSIGGLAVNVPVC